MPSNVELCRQNVMQDVSSAVQLDSDEHCLVRIRFRKRGVRALTIFYEQTHYVVLYRQMWYQCSLGAPP